MQDKSEIFKFLYGVEEEQFTGKIIISPFLPVKHIKQFTGDGWVFKGVLFEGFIGENITYIRCGTGASNIRDALLAFTRTDRRIFFVGSAGGFADLEIGDALFVEEAADKNGKFAPSFCKDIKNSLQTSAIKTGRVWSLEAVLDSKRELLLEKQEQGFCACELETASFYRSALDTGIEAQAFVYITDLPFEKGFWEQLAPEQAAAVGRARKLVLEHIINTDIRK